jgi:hypothetical protein
MVSGMKKWSFLLIIIASDIYIFQKEEEKNYSLPCVCIKTKSSLLNILVRLNNICEQGYEHRKESSGRIQIAYSLKLFLRQNNSKILFWVS